MDIERQKGAKLEPTLVRDFYNNLLSGEPEDYSYYRWFQSPFHRYQYRQTRRTIKSALTERQYDRSLEIGGGDGIWTELLLAHSRTVDYLDISAEMIKQAQKRLAGKPVTYYEQNFLENTLPSVTYDCIFSIRNFEYFPDKVAALKQFGRLLKPGGTLVLVTKSPDYDWSGYFKDKTFHSGQLNIKTLVTMLEAQGFVVIFKRPAIIGKKLSWAGLRGLFDLCHRLIIKTPLGRLLPLGIGKYLAESYALVAIKR